MAPVTLKSPLVSITQLKLQAICATQFTRKHILGNTCYICPEIQELELELF